MKPYFLIAILLNCLSLIAQDDLRVRTILVDMSLGGPVSYYERHSDDSNAMEAVKRWKNGIRVRNINSFERKIVEGSWRITYKGTNRKIEGEDVKLNY